MANKAAKTQQGYMTPMMGELAGQNKLYQGMGQDAYGSVNRNASQYGDAAQSMLDPAAFKRMMSGFEGNLDTYGNRLGQMWAMPGYSPDEKRGMTLGATQPIAAAHSGAATQMRNDAAMTGNNTGVNATASELARQRGREMSMAISGLQGTFGDARRQDQQFVMGASNPLLTMPLQGAGVQQQGLQLSQFPAEIQSQLFNTATGAQQGSNAMRANLINSLNGQAQKPGFWGDLLKAGLGNLAQGFGGGLM